MLEDVLRYYIYGETVDLGMAFSIPKAVTGLETDMLPEEFHKQIISCGNKCYKCSFCNYTYKKICQIKSHSNK
jgi:hypothetical protein